MKYIVDIDSLIDCLDCLGGRTKINGDVYHPIEIVKDFIKRFPKDPIKEEESND